MDVAKMMKLSIRAQRNVVTSTRNFCQIPRCPVNNPKRFLQKTIINNESHISTCNFKHVNSLYLCQTSSRLFSFDSGSRSSDATRLRIDSKNYGSTLRCNGTQSKKKYNSEGFRKTALLSVFGLALFQSKKEEDKKPEKDSPLVETIKRGILALQRDELNKAEQLLHIALKSAQETQNIEAITYIYDLLANLAYKREQYPKAEKLFVEVLKRMFEEGMADDDNAVVEISLKLASVYASQGDLQKAVEGFHFCILTEENKIKKHGEKNVDEDTLVLWAMSMDWYARFLLNLEQFDLAKKNFIKAYELCERLQGNKHPQTAVLLNDIGSVCSLQKNYTEAVSYLEKAIDAARESESSDIGSFYVNLGAVYLQQEMFGEAERCCKEGLKLAQKCKNSEAETEAMGCIEQIKEARKLKEAKP